MTVVAYLFVLGRATPVFHLAYTLLPGLDRFRFPRYGGPGGLPLNIELLLRTLEERFGPGSLDRNHVGGNTRSAQLQRPARALGCEIGGA